MDNLGVVDTTFATIDMGQIARDEFAKLPGYNERFQVISRTVPGFKDLAVEAKRLIEIDHCIIVVALGMPGREDIDEVCAHEASQGIMMAQLLTNTHILEVFVHMREARDEYELFNIANDRIRKHVRNAYYLIYEPQVLSQNAGKGLRQGSEDTGPINIA